jgi:hypothetical protein
MLAIARGNRLVRKTSRRGRTEKGRKRARLLSNLFSPPTAFSLEAETMVFPELDTSSQIYKVLQQLDEYDVEFAKQERMNIVTERPRANEGLGRTDDR